MSKVFCVGDAHFPFHNKKALVKLLQIIKREKPDAVVQIGDLLDQYVFSKYSRDISITPGEDVTDGLKCAEDFWKAVKKAAPKAKCYQILGNHDVRMAKRISEKLPELADMYGVDQLYKFPGVKVLKSDRDYLTIDGVNYCHGWLSKSIDHARYFNRPTVHGHRHRPAIETDGRLWSMDVGFLADENSTPLGYTQSKFSRWKLASGMVEDGNPRLFFLD